MDYDYSYSVFCTDETVEPGDSIYYYDDTTLLSGPGDYRVRLDYFKEDTLRNADAYFKVIESADSVLWYVIPRINTTNSVISMSITNVSADTIYIPNTAPWRITDSDTNHVYGPIKAFVILPVYPGMTRSWGWREIYDDGTPVPEGDYIAFVNYYPDTTYSSIITLGVDFILLNPEKDPFNPTCVWAVTDSLAYEEGSTVSFDFTNCAPDTIGMHMIHTWWIGNAIGFPVHIPIALAARTTIAPGVGFSNTWDQTDMDNPPKQVPPGWYYVFVTFSDKYYATHYVITSHPFLIGSPSTDTEEIPIPPGSLSQNYPNPFNPSTTIRYGIAERGHVSLRIYDIAGRLIRILVDEVQGPSGGQHEITWDGKDEAGRPAVSGVYFYRLVSKEVELNRKMILLK